MNKKLSKLLSKHEGWSDGYDEWLEGSDVNDSNDDGGVRFANASYISLLEDGTTRIQLYGACHVGLGSGTSSPVTLIISKVRRKENVDTPCPIAFSYIKWLITDSPWANVFLNPTVKSVFEDGAMIRTDIPSNHMMQAIQCTRYIWDRNYRIQPWSNLVKRGINPTLAFMMGHFFRHDCSNKKYYEWNLADYEHDVFNAKFINAKLYNSLLTSRFGTLNPDYYTRHSYVGVWKVWAKVDRRFITAEQLRSVKVTPVRKRSWGGESYTLDLIKKKDAYDFLYGKALELQEEWERDYNTAT